MFISLLLGDQLVHKHGIKKMSRFVSFYDSSARYFSDIECWQILIAIICVQVRAAPDVTEDGGAAAGGAAAAPAAAATASSSQGTAANFEAYLQSRDMTCGICMDKVYEKPEARHQIFGLLPNCNHPFCLQCIRTWRKTRDLEPEVTK